MLQHRPAVPGKYTLEVIAFQKDDPTYWRLQPNGTTAPVGVPLAMLRKEQEHGVRIITGWQGETYHLPLAAWADQDPEQTLLQFTYQFTPYLPVIIDVSLQTRHAPPASSQTPSHLPARLMSMLVCSDVRQEHKIVLRFTDASRGIAVEDLLKLPEAQADELQCPVCEVKVGTQGRIAQRLAEAASENTDPLYALLLCMHPAHLPETRVLPENTPLKVQRYWRYEAISTPAMPQDESLNFLIATKSHNHKVMLHPHNGITSARDLLALPEANEKMLTCPLCDATLTLNQSLGDYIALLAREMGGESIAIEWSISHPAELPETKSVVVDAKIVARRHDADDALLGKLRDEWLLFVLWAR